MQEDFKHSEACKSVQGRAGVKVAKILARVVSAIISSYHLSPGICMVAMKSPFGSSLRLYACYATFSLDLWMILHSGCSQACQTAQWSEMKKLTVV